VGRVTVDADAAREAVDDGSAETIGAALTRLMQATGRAKAHDHATNGPFHAMALLWVLREHGPLRGNALADLCHSDPSTVSRQVGTLVQQGLVRRESDPDDRRAAQLAITDKGREVVADRLRMRDAQLARITEAWSARDRARFAELFNRFATDFAAHVNEFAHLRAQALAGPPDRLTSTTEHS
jgi:DNA-binding MarR family transcriptional regulator